jgi:hypothetical protein
MATFSYADAVKLLGAKESKIVKALDKLLGGALLGGSVAGALDLLGWFDAKGDFVRLSNSLVTKLSERFTGLSRHSRTERLHAAHSVIVLVAFFQALDELNIPLTTKGLDLTRQRQLDLQARGTLFDAQVPLPTPDEPYETFVATLTSWYDSLAINLGRLVTGLAVWDTFDESTRARTRAVMEDALPQRSITRYEELFRQLCADCPEVALWTARLDAQATRTEIRIVGTALTQLADLLSTVTVGAPPAAQHAELARKYRSVLSHPILESDDVPGGLAIPCLQDGYIDPFFQVADVGPRTVYAQRSWWDTQPTWADIHRFFAGFLTSPAALTAPLLVLGDPGSGKSVLTKVLAAQLPASDFFVVRVELRGTPAEADLRRQIEHGLKEALAEEVSWPSMVRSAGQALPVVLLDGFDELLQATGVSQTDYLLKIARFQRDRADVGHPVAFVVTTRISVADRAVTPPGTVALRLASFQVEQKSRWLDVWHRTNTRYFDTSGLRPLDLDTALRYQELSGQPLLLLMLALYDADANALQNHGTLAGQAELYERLLTRFARREVTKDGDHRTSTELAQSVNDELTRLSIVAFAMFNRGAQWVTERDLDKDFAALLGAEPEQVGVRSPLGVGERTLGRFFFIQRSQASRADRTLSTYEFLHATFGEYLVARLTWHRLVELSTQPRRLSGDVDDGDLYSLLSFTPLSDRVSIIDFLLEMASAGQDVAGCVAELAASIDKARTGTYRPVELPAPARYAAYSANLTLLSVIVNSDLRFGEIFRKEADPAEAWRRYAGLWRSQLTIASWNSLVRVLRVDRVGERDERDTRLSIERDVDNIFAVPPLDVAWLAGIEVDGVPGVLQSAVLGVSSRQTYFGGEADSQIMMHALEPLDEVLPHAETSFVRDLNGEWMSGAHALLGFLAGPGSIEDMRYLETLTRVATAKNSDLYGRVVFDVLRTRSHAHYLRLLADYDWIAGDPRFWSVLCGQMGKGKDDIDLVSLFCVHADLKTALSLIPEDVVDAWVRMAEADVELDPSAPALLDVLLAADLDGLARVRPDLVKRARNALSEVGLLDEINLPPH